MTLLDSPGKVAAIRDVADKRPDIDTFIETGTACGDLPYGVADIFGRIVTVEMDPHSHAAAARRLSDFGHVEALLGDSAGVLVKVLSGVDEPCLFWLDAHEIADDGDSALDAELNIIAHLGGDYRHVVLIDDARLCSGRKGWPTLADIEAWADANGYRHRGVTDDIITLER